MFLPDLTDFLAAVEDDAGLDLPIGGRTYRVRPPSTARGLRMAAFVAANQLPASERAAAQTEALGGVSLAALALGHDVATTLVDDDVPAAIIDAAAIVALIAFTYGPEAAADHVKRRIEATARPTQPTASPPSVRSSRKPKQSGTPMG